MVVFRIVLFLLTIESVRSIQNESQLYSKLPNYPLMRYNSYSSVMILHFNIPVDTEEVSFKFQAKDESSSFLVVSCAPRNISVYMKPGSYPVINPDGVPFPKTFLNISRPELHELILQTDLKANYINITSPKPGDWFGAAFVSWTDPKKDRIEQEGLSSQCEASLFSELHLKQKTKFTILTPNSVTEVNLNQQKSELFKFYVPEDIDHVLISIEILTPCRLCDNLTIYVQNQPTLNVSNKLMYEEKLLVNGKMEGKDSILFFPQERKWHYLNMTLVEKILKNKLFKDYAIVNVHLKYISDLRKETNCNVTNNIFRTSLNKQTTVKNKNLQYNLPYKQYNLMRLTAPDNFIFEYDFQPDNGTSHLLLNVTENEMSVLKFEVYNIIDIGGTLTLGLAIKPEFKGKKQNSGNYSIIACIRSNVKEIPTYPDLCVYGDESREAAIKLNSSAIGKVESMHIPFPDPGIYFLSIRAFFEPCIECSCSGKCKEKMRKCFVECERNCTIDCDSCNEECEEEIYTIDSCMNCNCDGVCERNDDNQTRNTSLIFSILSNPCIEGSCGKRGQCNHYMSGGFIFSACRCYGGYRGWDCSDDKEALSDAEILLEILLLTLSNLLFIPSIYFAYKRHYYTEAVAYFCSMFSSTFYHACDSKAATYGWCLFPLGVLQFCDFFCALLAIWVTLVAMAHTKHTIISIAHVAGAVVLAFGVTYNKHALWLYVLPTLIGLVLIGINWGIQCKRTGKIYPAKGYLKMYMPAGTILVVMGLASFAFLETKENYKIVHSIWHCMMAISLLFLLPNKQTFISLS